MTGRDNHPTDFDLTCWYLNAKRAVELVGVDHIVPDIRRINALGEIDDALKKNMTISVIKDRSIRMPD